MDRRTEITWDDVGSTLAAADPAPPGTEWQSERAQVLRDAIMEHRRRPERRLARLIPIVAGIVALALALVVATRTERIPAATDPSWLRLSVFDRSPRSQDRLDLSAWKLRDSRLVGVNDSVRYFLARDNDRYCVIEVDGGGQGLTNCVTRWNLALMGGRIQEFADHAIAIVPDGVDTIEIDGRMSTVRGNFVRLALPVTRDQRPAGRYVLRGSAIPEMLRGAPGVMTPQDEDRGLVVRGRSDYSVPDETPPAWAATLRLPVVDRHGVGNAAGQTIDVGRMDGWWDVTLRFPRPGPSSAGADGVPGSETQTFRVAVGVEVSELPRWARAFPGDDPIIVDTNGDLARRVGLGSRELSLHFEFGQLAGRTEAAAADAVPGAVLVNDVRGRGLGAPQRSAVSLPAEVVAAVARGARGRASCRYPVDGLTAIGRVDGRIVLAGRTSTMELLGVEADRVLYVTCVSRGQLNTSGADPRTLRLAFDQKDRRQVAVTGRAGDGYTGVRVDGRVVPIVNGAFGFVTAHPIDAEVVGEGLPSLRLLDPDARSEDALEWAELGLGFDAISSR